MIGLHINFDPENWSYWGEYHPFIDPEHAGIRLWFFELVWSV